MKINLISDTHFEHKNIKVYTNRPDNWTERITNSLVLNNDADVLIHLGDVSLGNDAHWHETITHGDFKSWLILGNHDGKSIHWYLNNGWDFVARSAVIYIFGVRILFTHRPYPFPPQKTVTRELRRGVAFSEEMTEIPRSSFDVNIAGHVHTRKIELPNWCHPYIIEEQDYKPIDLLEFLNERNLINTK